MNWSKIEDFSDLDRFPEKSGKTGQKSGKSEKSKNAPDIGDTMVRWKKNGQFRGPKAYGERKFRKSGNKYIYTNSSKFYEFLANKRIIL